MREYVLTVQANNRGTIEKVDCYVRAFNMESAYAAAIEKFKRAAALSLDTFNGFCD